MDHNMANWLLGDLADMADDEQPNLGLLNAMPPDVLRMIRHRLEEEEQGNACEAAPPETDGGITDDEGPMVAADPAAAMQGMAVGRPGSPADSASLQDDVLRIILGLVFREERDPGAMAGMRLLGPQWRRLVGSEVESVAPATLESISQLCMFPTLQQLDLRRAAATESINPAVLEHLPNALRGLTALDLGGWRSLSWGQVGAAAKLRKLAKLSLAGCHLLPGVCLAELTPLARCLHSLDLRGCTQLRDLDLVCVGELSSLQELRMDGCEQLTDKGIEALQPLDGVLQHLDIGSCHRVIGASLPQLAQGLTRLGANDCGRLVRGNGQSNLAALSQLRRLDCLGDLPGSGEGLAAVLSGLSNLQHLSAPGAAHSQGELHRYSVLTALTAVNLAHANFGVGPTEALSAVVTGWHLLRRLNLAGNALLLPSEVEAITTHAQRLTLLDLSACLLAITSTSAAAIAARLTRLEVFLCQPTSSSVSIAPLAGLPRLRELNLGTSAVFAAVSLCTTLAMATKLTRLAVSIKSIGDGSLAPLERLPRLKALALTVHMPRHGSDGHRIEHRALAAALPQLQRLTELALAPGDKSSGRRLSLSLLRAAAALPRLRKLILDGNSYWTASEVTTALAPAAQLRLISAAGCGLEALERNLPQFRAHPYLRLAFAPPPADSDSEDEVA